MNIMSNDNFYSSKNKVAIVDSRCFSTRIATFRLLPGIASFENFRNKFFKGDY